VLLFAGLLAAGLVALRQQTLREFPSESAEAAPEVTAAEETPTTPPVSPPAG
jgi:hypothetical protein